MDEMFTMEYEKSFRSLIWQGNPVEKCNLFLTNYWVMVEVELYQDKLM